MDAQDLKALEDRLAARERELDRASAGRGAIPIGVVASPARMRRTNISRSKPLRNKAPRQDY
jgi:hypothetical protein